MLKSKGLRWLHATLALETDACIPWPYSVQSNGYGDFRTKETGHKLAHRWVCEQAHGPAPGDYDAAHKCGTRLCCNKRHLTWKTRADNLEDRREHGTLPMGENATKSILTEQQVEQIRRAARMRGMGAALTRQHGVHPSTVYAIRDRRSWKHLPA